MSRNSKFVASIVFLLGILAFSFAIYPFWDVMYGLAWTCGLVVVAAFVALI